MKRLTIFGFMAWLLTACAPSGAPSEPHNPQFAAVDQSRLCEVTDWHHDVVKKACTPGQKVVFLPASWGNEQLPVIFAAVNCDMRYSVALTDGGVACIFAPIVVDGEDQSEAAKPPVNQ